MNLDDIKKRVFVSCPFNLLKDRYLSAVLEHGINPEIGLNSPILDQYSFRDFFQIARALSHGGLSCTIHAPFTDISPGAFDLGVRQASISKLKQAIDLGVLFQARSLVLHSGWEHKIYSDMTGQWLNQVIDSLGKLVDHARGSGVRLMLENVFELDPSLHEEIFRHFSKEELGFCLDLGHVYAFSTTSLAGWLDALDVRVAQLHLHDNHGGEDEHLPPGAGIIDFDLVFSRLKSISSSPILTLEAHDEDSVIPGLTALGRLIEGHNLAKDPS